MIRQTLDSAKKRMEKCISDMQQNLASHPDRSSVRQHTGPHSGQLLRHPDAIEPDGLALDAGAEHDRDPAMGSLHHSEHRKGHLASDLGLTPTNDGKVMRLPIPPLTQERRKQLAKSVAHIAEQHKVAVRQVRHEANDQLKAYLKDKRISEDDEKEGLKKIQDLTNDFIGKVDSC